VPDITEKLLPQLLAHRIEGIDIGSDLIHPNYSGGSILNIPSTVAEILGAPGLPTPPLHPEIMEHLGEGVQNVVFILMDALALHRLQRWIAEDSSLIWGQLAEAGILAPLTSITPSTTSAAITSLWTGASPAQHGIGGYELWLKEYGIVSNMINHKPIVYPRRNSDGLEVAGFDPQAFLPVEPITSHLISNEINVHAFQHRSIANSRMSQMFLDEVTMNRFITVSDLWIGVRQLLETEVSEKTYAWVYYDALDSLSHDFGPDDERPAAEFAHFSMAFERFFINELSEKARKNTLVILSADHGQIKTDLTNSNYYLSNHPELTRRLHLMPTGENRLTYLHVRPGQLEAVREYIERAWPNQFYVLDSNYALHSGLFGLGEPYNRFPERIGDLTVIGRGNAYWWWSDKNNHIIGRHGGMHPEEMLVPFLAVSL